MPPELIDSAADEAMQYDSEALWATLGEREWRATSVLVVRGTRGRPFLRDRLVERGASVDEVAAYERQVPAFSASEQATLDEAFARPEEHLWLFSSSEAIEQLVGLPGARETLEAAARGRVHLLATHPRIAERARALGFSRVHETRAALADVVACIQSIRP